MWETGGPVGRVEGCVASEEPRPPARSADAASRISFSKAAKGAYLFRSSAGLVPHVGEKREPRVGLRRCGPLAEGTSEASDGAASRRRRSESAATAAGASDGGLGTGTGAAVSSLTFLALRCALLVRELSFSPGSQSESSTGS